MVQVCEGLKTKNDMLEQAINQYKEIYIKARSDFGKVINVSLLHTDIVILPSQESYDGSKFNKFYIDEFTQWQH